MYDDQRFLSAGDFARGTVSRPLDLEFRTKAMLVPMFERVDARNRKCVSQLDFAKAFGTSRYAAMSEAAGDPNAEVMGMSRGVGVGGAGGLAGLGEGPEDEGSPAWRQAVLETVTDAFDANKVKILEIFDETLEDPETELEAGDYENDLLPAAVFRQLLQKWYAAGIAEDDEYEYEEDAEEEGKQGADNKTVISKYGMDSLTRALDRQSGADGKISRAEFQ